MNGDVEVVDHRSHWRTALYVLAGWMPVTFFGELLQTGGKPAQIDVLVRGGLIYGVVAGATFIVAAVSYLGWWAKVGMRRPQNVELLWLPALALVLFAQVVATKGLPAPATVWIVVVNTVLVGISEELMFRGVLLHGASDKYGVWRGVLISAAIFGSIHVLNGIITHSFGVALVQALLAALFGLWAGAFRVRTESILPVIAIHCLWDCLLILGGAESAVFALFFEFALAGYGLWLLRPYWGQAPPAPPIDAIPAE